jgi:hypothetical protein
MSRKYNGLWICLIAGQVACAQDVYRTEIYRGQIKSLEVKVAGELISEPFIELNGDQRLEIDFDALNHTQGRYAYTLIHCEADWRKSALFPTEYMEGFQGMTIDDFAQAFNTTVHYTHFRLFLPNEYVRFKVSGNYALLVHEEDDPDKIAFCARISVCESLIDLQASLTGNTDRAFNTIYQQVSFRIDTRNLPVAYPQTDLKIRVNQNRQTDHEVTGLQPSSLSSRLLIYEHIPALIFEAGNEYRRIEFLTHRYNGLNIERIQYFNPFYHADVTTDQSRTNQAYRYDQDQNGRFFVRCSNCQDPDVEADYFIVHFAYASEPLAEGGIYLLGDFLLNRLDEHSQMVYNPQTGCYEKAVLLKQGYYNYQYVYLPHGATRGEALRTEGSYYQTENEYAITVYYRPAGGRYDRIIGRTTVRNAQETL